MKVFIGDPCYAMNQSDYHEMLGICSWADDFDDGTLCHPWAILSSSDEHNEEELEESLYDNYDFWHNGFGDAYPEIEGKVINAVKRAPTWIGDGVYADQHGRGYCVDSGQLGLVPEHMWKCSEERLNQVGRVVELDFDQFFLYDLKESGTLDIAGYRIVTGPADYNGDPVEDEEDS